MNSKYRMRLSIAALALLVGISAAWAAATATFTADGSGTFGGTFQYDRKTKVLTVDLSGIGKDANIFRAELMLNARGGPPFKPTTVHPVGKPEKKLKFVAPRFVSLDALDAVKAAVDAGSAAAAKVGELVCANVIPAPHAGLTGVFV